MQKAVLIIFLFTSGLIFAQEDQLANRYYEQGKYDKAVEIYLNLYKSNPSGFFYQRITSCYKELGDDEAAISFIRSDLRKNRYNEPRNQVDLIYYYGRLKNDKQQQKETDKLLDFIKDQPARVHNVSKMLSDKGLFELALTAFEAAEKAQPNMRLTYQKAQMYAELGRLEDMFDSYIDMIEQSPSYLTTVKSLLSRSLSKDPEDKHNQYVKAGLIKRLQKNSDEYMTDVLIHVFMHEENFAGALQQSFAQDKRRQGDQVTVYRLGQVSLEHEDFQTAFKAWDYIIEKKPPSEYANAAIVERFRTSKAELDRGQTEDTAAYTQLAKNILGFIESKNWGYPGADLARTLAEIEAFQLLDYSSAIRHLKRMDNVSRLPLDIRIQGKLLLGDINLFAGKYTDALLAYAQAEKLAGDQPIGDEAKLRMGKVAYFQADFTYALNTFDVLKSSTSKHTANDAMKLSLLIRENTMLDTNYEAMTRFAQAELLHFRKKYPAALRELRLLRNDFPGHTLQDEILLRKAKILIDTYKYEEAVETLESLISEYPDGILADETLLLLGNLYAGKRNNPELAMKYYEQLITQFPNSYFVSEARKNYRKLRGDINF
jgi:tetratricopeptide (TPR) repeat protein